MIPVMETDSIEFVDLTAETADFADVDDFQDIRPTNSRSQNQTRRMGQKQSLRSDKPLSSLVPHTPSEDSLSNRPFYNNPAFGVASPANGALLPGFQGEHATMSTGRKRKPPTSFDQMYEQPHHADNTHESLFLTPNSSPKGFNFEPATPSSFKMPRGLETVDGLASYRGGMSPNGTPRKKKCSGNSTVLQSGSMQDVYNLSRARSDTMSPELSTFRRSSRGSNIQTFTPVRPSLERGTTSTISIPKASSQVPQKPSSSSTRRRDSHSQRFHNSTGTCRRDGASSNRAPSPALSNFTNQSSDPNNLMGTLNDIQNVLSTLQNQHSQLLRDLAVRVNGLQIRLDALEKHVHATLERFASMMNKNFDGIRREFTDKLQETIDSNDEVVNQQNPVAGGDYGGPRMPPPPKAHRVFHGLMGSKP